MKSSRLLPNIPSSVLAVFSGAVIWRQFSLFQYFYNSKADDFLLITCITLFCSIIAYKYLKLGNQALALVRSITLLTGLAIFIISYQVFEFVDIVGLLTYLFCLLAAISIVPVLKEEASFQLSLAAVAMAVLIGGLIQYLFGGIMYIWSLGILYIALSIVTARVESHTNRQWAHGALALLLAAVFQLFSSAPKLYTSQKSYYDKVVYAQHTGFQNIDITEWRGQRWFYYNGINNFSTIDEWLYYEPLVHPVMELSKSAQNVLVIGGDNGLAIREVLKHQEVNHLKHLILDTALYQLAKSHDLFTAINQHSLQHNKVSSQQQNIFRHLNSKVSTYDVVIVDMPDPVDLELNQYYTQAFYELCYQSLSPDGMLITQAGSPYFASQAYYCISNTVRSAQFSVLEMHNQVLTMGEWGWIVGSKNLEASQLRSNARTLEFDDLTTTWLNNEAMQMMLSFGKTNVNINDSIINTIKKPIVHAFYTKGNWDFN
jgi:spermidine synthase